MSEPTEPVAARPATAAGARAFTVTPFARMARTHAASAMGDAMVAASLAGSLFFTLPAGDARQPVLRYLVITMLPFAVLSPLIGPAIDRMKGGHRLMVIASLVSRAVACYLMAGEVSGNSPLFFLYALFLLVCQRAYQVARSALVPSVVRSDAELVEANSKLSLLSGFAGFLGLIPAGIAMGAFGPEWSLGLAMVAYVVGAVLGTRIDPVRVASESADETERHELRGASIVMAGSAMGLIRACVGFLTLLVAFDFRGGDRAPWEFGVVGAVSALSQLAGAAVGPQIRRRTSEENLLSGVLALMVLGGLIAVSVDELVGATILGATVGFAAGGGKLAFDSILQRDAPDANRGRAFARFETRFQVLWVFGALVPVAFDIDAEAGFWVVLVLAVIALGTYATARMSYAHRMGTHQSAATAAAVGIEERFAEVSGEVKDRLASAPRAAYRRLRSRQDGPPEGYDIDDEDPDGLPYDEEDDHRGYGYQDPAHHPPAPAPAPAPEPEPATVESDVSGDEGYGVDAYGDEAFGDDPRSWAQPQWADAAPGPVAPGEGSQAGYAEDSVGWDPPDDEYPWEPPVDPRPAPGAYLADVDPSVRNPYPWAPDDDAPDEDRQDPRG